MAIDINQCMIEGRLGADPEEKILGSGSKVANARIAVQDDYKDRQGQWVERTYWITIRAGGRAADELLRFEKGQKIIVVGKWTVEEYQKDGRKQFYNKLDIQHVRGSDHRYPQRQDQQGQQHQPQQRAAREPAASRSSTDFDDDIPF